jgi:hypothetical protein
MLGEGREATLCPLVQAILGLLDGLLGETVFFLPVCQGFTKSLWRSPCKSPAKWGLKFRHDPKVAT